MDILDEAIRDEKDEKKVLLFKKALPIVIVATIIIMIIVGIVTWFSNKATKHNNQMSDTLHNAVVLQVSNQKEEALSSFDFLEKDAKSHIADLAALSKIRILQDKPAAEVLAMYKSIIEGKNYHEITKSYAKLIWLTKALDLPDEQVDQNSLKEYFSYFSNETQMFFGTANVLQALWLVKHNEIAKATQILHHLLNSKYVNYTNKNNAQAILSNLNNTNN